jgi:hypothetical protein
MFETVDIDRAVQSSASQKKKGLNFIRLISPGEGAKCSVVLSYRPDKAFISLKGEIMAQPGRADPRYFGLAPSVNEYFIIEEIQKGERGVFGSCESFEAYLDQNADKFMLHAGCEDAIRPLFAAVLLQMAWHFTDKQWFHTACPQDLVLLQLTDDPVYYNGVIPRLLHIESETPVSADRVFVMSLNFERTTYATINLFDGYCVGGHPWMKDYDAAVKAFFQKESRHRAETLINADPSQNKLLQTVNTYLCGSCYVNNIAVSGNLTTADKKLILAHRSSKSIDSNQYYCSVNGQSETIDTDVRHYMRSVFEDYPTIDINSPFRLDFEAELTRESMAELKTDRLDAPWSYYGIAVLGIKDSLRSGSHNTRLQFNVLAKNSTRQSFAATALRRSDAPEAFENKAIAGLRLRIYESIPSRIFGLFKAAAAFVIERNDIIFALLALLVFFSTKDILAADLQNIRWGEWASLAVSLLLILLVVIRAVLSKGRSRALQRDIIRLSVSRKLLYHSDAPERMLIKMTHRLAKRDKKAVIKHKSKTAQSEHEKNILNPIVELMLLLHVRDMQTAGKRDKQG